MRLEYIGPSVLRANQLFTAFLRVFLDETLPCGGRIVLAMRHFSDMADPQISAPEGENFISIAGPGRWELGDVHEGKRHPWNRGIDLKLIEGTLPAGEMLTITLGDPTHGCPGYRCQSFAETHFRFRLGVDKTGNGDWVVLPLESCPGFQVRGNQTTSLKAVVSSATRTSAPMHVHIKPEDAYGNVACDVPSSVTLLSNGYRPVGHNTLVPNQASLARVSVEADTSPQRLIITTGDGRFWGTSNPFGKSLIEGYDLFFGEIHGQSALCDGTNQPAEIYQYAREVAGLDFASVTSHDFELTSQDWELMKRATRDAHAPGDFVTFLGLEWSGMPHAGGDNNIYFFEDDAPLVHSAPIGCYNAWDPAAGEVVASQNLKETIETLKGHRCMVVPHCGGRCCNLDFYCPDVMPLFEIHSSHRTYEHVAHESIRRGIHFGFIGGSDDHRGALGDAHTAARDRFFSSHSGLVAAYAKDLTRESLWEAFFSRRVYATNGPRIVLAVDIDGYPMGSRMLSAPGVTRRMSIQVWLDGLLDRIEVMQDDIVIKTVCGIPNQIEEFEDEIEFCTKGNAHAYYVRVFQTDGGRAWSSPVWISQHDQI